MALPMVALEARLVITAVVRLAFDCGCGRLGLHASRASWPWC